MSRLNVLAGCFVLLALGPPALPAQSIWIGDPPGASLSADLLKPSFAEEESATFGFFTAGLYLTGRFPVARRLRLIGEVPVSFISIDSEFLNESETALGNPYLGVEIGGPEQALLGEVGVRVPLAPSENRATSTGVFTDFDRFEAFVPDVASVQAALAYRLALPGGLYVRLRGGPVVDFSTDDEVEEQTDVLASYAAQGWYDGEAVLVGVGVSGRAILTENNLRLNDRTVHHIGLATIGQFHPFYPGLLIRIPVDAELADIIDLVVGLSLTVALD